MRVGHLFGIKALQNCMNSHATMLSNKNGSSLGNCNGHGDVVRILKDADDSREERDILLLLDDFLYLRHGARPEDLKVTRVNLS